MNHPVVIASSLLLLASLSTAFAQAKKAEVKKPEAPKAKPEQTKKATPADKLSNPGKVIQVNSKTPQFTINLKSNPTTGYSWVLLGDYDHSLIKPVGHKFHLPGTRLVGAPGYESFTFKIAKEGFDVPQKTTLMLQYVRPWLVVSNTQKLKFTIITVNEHMAKATPASVKKKDKK